MRRCLILLLLSICCTHLHGQTPSIPDTGRVIILSSRVGPNINPTERQMFGLFESILILISGSTHHFRNAVVLQLPDSTFRVRFTLARENGPPRDTLVTYSFEVLWRIAERIDYLEEIQAGRYQPGQRPPPLLSTSGEMVFSEAVGRPRASTVHGSIPLASSEGVPYPRYFPALNFGIGLCTYGPDLSGLSEVFGKTPSLGLSPLVSGLVELAVVDAFAIQAQGAISIAGEDCFLFAGGGSYFVPLVPSGRVRLFANASVLFCSFRSEPSGLVVEGGGAGFSGSLGVVLHFDRSATVDFYAGLCSLPTVATTFTDVDSSGKRISIPASIKLSSLIFGIRLRFLD